MAQAPGQTNSFFSSVMDAFRGGSSNNPVPGGAPAPGGGNPAAFPGNNGGQPGMADPNNPTIPAGQGGVKDPNENKSPMADFASLWDNTPVKDGEQPQTDWNDPLSIVPAENFDSAKVSAAAKNIDFSRSMNPESVKKALAGDPVAFSEYINSVVQAAFSNSALLSSRMMQQTLRQMAPRLINDALPHHMKRHGINEGLVAENPIFNDPAVAPMLEGLKMQLQIKNPKAPAAEITRMAKDYITKFAGSFTKTPAGGNNSGQPGAAGNQGQQGEPDWIKDFLESGNSTQGPQI